MTTDEIHRAIALNELKLTPADVASLLRALQITLLIDLEQTRDTRFISAHLHQARELLHPSEAQEVGEAA